MADQPLIASEILPMHLHLALSDASTPAIVSSVSTHMSTHYDTHQAQAQVCQSYSSSNMFDAALRVFNHQGQRQLQGR